jgi:DNA-directed RNA polymerase subunit RPC12/RpoP
MGRCVSCSRDFRCPEKKTKPRFEGSETKVASCPHCRKTCVMKEVEKGSDYPDFRCPECFGGEVLVILRRWAELIQEDDNIQTQIVESDDDEWDENSLMKCRGCDHFAMAKRFYRPRVPEQYLLVGESDVISAPEKAPMVKYAQYKSHIPGEKDTWLRVTEEEFVLLKSHEDELSAGNESDVMELVDKISSESSTRDADLKPSMIRNIGRDRVVEIAVC